MLYKIKNKYLRRAALIAAFPMLVFILTVLAMYGSTVEAWRAFKSEFKDIFNAGYLMRQCRDVWKSEGQG